MWLDLVDIRGPWPKNSGVIISCDVKYGIILIIGEERVYGVEIMMC